MDEGKMARVGCTARIVKVLERYEDGRVDLLVRGEERFRILQLYQEAAYGTADIETIEEPERAPERALQERVITQHMRLLELAGRTVRPSLYEDVRALSYIIAPNAGLTLQQKQDLLELMTEKERVDYLVEHLESLIPRVERLEGVRRKIQSNGHFKDFPPEG
jgi:ATP-dependent Lon protease